MNPTWLRIKGKTMDRQVKPSAGEFDYAEFTNRNLGFVSEKQQLAIRAGKVFVCGVGGMGGACVQSLVRAGLGNLCIADFDRFELSNLNRQLFADLETLNRDKIQVTISGIQRINPTIHLEVYGREWPTHINSILSNYPVVVNGMDDVNAGVFLYRKAREFGTIVIDAYPSTLPSVTLVKPHDPRPEERLSFPTRGKDWQAITAEMASECLLKEMIYVMVHSSTTKHVIMNYATEILAGRRARMSFAPMVITTGNLMSYEALSCVLGTKTSTDYCGYFFNPYNGRTEHPRNPIIARSKTILATQFLRQIISEDRK